MVRQCSCTLWFHGTYGLGESIQMGPAHSDGFGVLGMCLRAPCTWQNAMALLRGCSQFAQEPISRCRCHYIHICIGIYIYLYTHVSYMYMDYRFLLLHVVPLLYYMYMYYIIMLLHVVHHLVVACCCMSSRGWQPLVFISCRVRRVPRGAVHQRPG